MTYIALTIGPIYKTLSNAKKTRELWGGSYLFSYIMKQIISHFKEREFVVPYIKDDSIFEQGNEVGLFHDRFIFKSEKGDLEKLKNRIDEVIFYFVKDSGIDKSFLTNYLQIHYIEKELEEKDNPILKLTPYLDTQELFFSTFQYSNNQIEEFLKKRISHSFLVQDAFEKRKTSFPSLPEIALYDILTPNIKKLIQNDDEKIYENISSKRYHKYIAIVHADGDSMGRVVESLKSQDDFNNFSKNLFNYCKESHRHIINYGGHTIFAGGDDLLFFAPVVSGSRTVFNLCDDISNSFNRLFEQYNTEPKATLSFGVSITYYKFPLYEALESSRGLLFGKAKNNNKNNIAFKVTKHSGQSFESIIHKGKQDIYKKFLAFTSNIKEGKDVDNFLHSIHHKIDTYSLVINEIGSNKDSVKNFFDNYFNEDVHIEYQDFFNTLVEFIVSVYSDETIKKEDKLKLIYSTLRFVKFIKGDKQ